MVRNCRPVSIRNHLPGHPPHPLRHASSFFPLPNDGPNAHRKCIHTLTPPKALGMHYPITALELENNVVISVPAPTIAPVAITA